MKAIKKDAAIDRRNGREAQNRAEKMRSSKRAEAEVGAGMESADIIGSEAKGMDKEQTVFLSYCWVDTNIADEIDRLFANTSLQIVRDVRDLGYFESIKEFMKKIRGNDYVILIISDNYLKSKNCMFEVLELLKEANYSKRIYPLILSETNIFSTYATLDYIRYWKNEYDVLNQSIEDIGDSTATNKVAEDLKIIGNIYRDINEFLSLVKEIRCPRSVYELYESIRNGLSLTLVSGSPIRSNYTLSSFIVGNSNLFAYAAAKAIIDDLVDPRYAEDHIEARYNPILFYGPSGTGKTHLVQAIVNEIARMNPGVRILYFQSMDFVNQYIDTIRNDTLKIFYDEIKKADILIMDDLHFVGGRSSTQEAFLYLFNELYLSHKQIIAVSNRRLKNIFDIMDNITTRFESGLMVDISYPSLSERMEILQNVFDSKKISISESLLNEFAENTVSISDIIGVSLNEEFKQKT